MANRVKKIRESLGLKQRELAEQIHACQSDISALETGRLRPRIGLARKLSRALKVPVRELFPDDFN